MRLADCTAAVAAAATRESHPSETRDCRRQEGRAGVFARSGGEGGVGGRSRPPLPVCLPRLRPLSSRPSRLCEQLIGDRVTLSLSISLSPLPSLPTPSCSR